MATLKRSHVKELEAKKVQMEKLSIKLHQQLAAARADNLLLEQKVEKVVEELNFRSWVASGKPSVAQVRRAYVTKIRK